MVGGSGEEGGYGHGGFGRNINERKEKVGSPRKGGGKSSGKLKERGGVVKSSPKKKSWGKGFGMDRSKLMRLRASELLASFGKHFIGKSCRFSFIASAFVSIQWRWRLSRLG